MKASKIRALVQISFLLFMTWVGYLHQMLGGGREGAPAVDALCPFGGMESLYIFLTSGGWLRRVAPSAMILLIAVIGMTIISGRVFCGWICPLGTLGEFTAKISSRLKIRKRELPRELDNKLRYLKYVVLIVIIYFTWKMGTLVWRDYDPWVAYMHLSAGWSEMVERPVAFIVLFGTVIFASLFIERFWCRYLCPLGALLAPLQKLSLIKVRRSDEHCIHCHLCSGICPVRLDPEAQEVETSAECIACGECVEKCPKEKALFFGTSGKKFKPLTVGLVGLVIFFGAYGTARITGTWRTWAPVATSVTSTDPTEALFGWMSIQQMADTMNMPVERVIELGELPGDIALNVPVKEIEGVNDEELKEKIQENLLKEPSHEGRDDQSSSQLPPPDEIRGSMTMDQISSTYGLEGEKIFEKAGWPIDSDPATSLKTLAGEMEREVSEIREAVRELLEEQDS